MRRCICIVIPSLSFCMNSRSTAIDSSRCIPLGLEMGQGNEAVGRSDGKNKKKKKRRRNHARITNPLLSGSVLCRHIRRSIYSHNGLISSTHATHSTEPPFAHAKNASLPPFPSPSRTHGSRRESMDLDWIQRLRLGRPNHRYLSPLFLSSCRRINVGLLACLFGCIAPCMSSRTQVSIVVVFYETELVVLVLTGERGCCRDTFS